MHATKLFTVGAIAVAMGLGTSADGACKAFKLASGAWETAGNWTPSGVPGTNDFVSIPANASVTITSSVETGVVHVLSGATLTIGSSGALTLNGNGDNSCVGSPADNVHVVTGSIVLSSSSSVLKFNNLSADQTIQGTGSLTGQDNAARIEIQTTYKLINKMTIQGALVIDRVGSSGTATFENYRDANTASMGLVLANKTGGSGGSPYILKFAANIDLAADSASDAYKAVFEANGDNYSQLQFDHQDYDLNQDFSMLGCSDFVMNQDVTTSGTFNEGSARGTVDVNNGAEFDWDGGGPVNVDTNYTSGGSC